MRLIAFKGRFRAIIGHLSQFPLMRLFSSLSTISALIFLQYGAISLFRLGLRRGLRRGLVVIFVIIVITVICVSAVPPSVFGFDWF